MASTGFAFPDVHRRDSRFTNDLPLRQERDSSHWLVDDERSSCEKSAPVPAKGTAAPLSSTVAEDIRSSGEIRSEAELEGILGRSSALGQVVRLVKLVAPSDATVLLLGETGTGKELIARAIHSRSRREKWPFVKLNCAAIPTGLLESELFGHERGAFTGAIAQKVGRLELADKGSLFLDEIGDIPLELQPKLLRVLQEREFDRLGSTQTQRVDVRVVAATHRNLEEMILEKHFRSDLYYRLNVFPISIPPLRQRLEDIPLLIRHFVAQFALKMNKRIESIPSETMSALSEYRWPGNIRELQNVIERAVILSQGPALQIAFSELKTNGAPATDLGGSGQSQDHGNIRSILEQTERKQILAALQKTHWVVAGSSGAATCLGMKRSTLQARMQKLGIVRSSKQIEKGAQIPSNFEGRRAVIQS
jgi:formate hydrogenlyase transcriptional activator